MEDIEEKILKELDMTPKVLEDGIKHLTEWIVKRPHLPNIEDEELLKSFIIGSKSVERAKERLEKYFTSKTINPELFSKRDPNNICWEQVEKIMLLPGLTPDGCKVLFMIEPTTKDELDKFSFLETARAGFMILDNMLRSTPLISGLIIVVDCQTASSEMLVKVITTHTPTIFNVYQQALPIRTKSLICINATSFVETFCNNVLKLFFSEKLRERIVVHSGDHAILSKYFPKEMLPQEYGGENSTVDELFEDTKQALMKEKEWFLNEGSLGSDETLRPKAEEMPEQLQGTFTKLQID